MDGSIVNITLLDSIHRSIGLLNSGNSQRFNSRETSITIYNMFNELIRMYGLEAVADEMGLKPEILERAVLCFGYKIPHIAVTKMPSLKLHEKIINSIILSLFLILSIIGNIMLIHFLNPFNFSLFLEKRRASNRVESISSNRRKSILTDVLAIKPSNASKIQDTFFWNTAIIDLIWSSFVIPFQILLTVDSGFWVLGDTGCKIYGYASYLILCITSLIMFCISTERFYRIIITESRYFPDNVPGKSCLKKIFCSDKEFSDSHVFKTYISLLIILFLSFFLTMPYLIFTNSYAIVNGTQCLSMTEFDICLNKWNDTTLEYIYKILFSLLIYLVPGILLCISYGSIAYNLFYKKKNIFDSVSKNKLTIKKRLTKILIFDSGFYIICWFPYLFWVVLVCIEELTNTGESTLADQMSIFIFLYTGPICNVSLRWSIRMYSIWPRVKNSFGDISRRISVHFIKLDVNNEPRARHSSN